MRRLSKVFLAMTFLAAGFLFPAVVMADPELTPTNIAASSTLTGGDYDAWNLLDYDQTTAWVEGVSGDGIGEFVDYFYPSGTVITGGVIYPAYYKNQDIFEKNSGVNIIKVQSGNQSMEVICSTAASSMVNGGYTFEIAGGIICDGTLRTSIESIRPGWKYTDTCISELHFYGYSGGSSSDASTGSASAGSASADSTSGGSESFSRSTAENLAVMASQIFKHHYGWSSLPQAALDSDNLTGEDMAFGLYWYQYHCDDSRVAAGGEFNQIDSSGIESIGKELFAGFSSQTRQIFIDSYGQGANGNYYSFYATGDFGDAGPYYFEVEGVRKNKSGDVQIYGSVNKFIDSAASSFVAEYKSTGAEALGGWQFVSVTVS